MHDDTLDTGAFSRGQTKGKVPAVKEGRRKKRQSKCGTAVEQL